ncbi:hypothetical protein EFK50_16995 [Nocardioides marmoriginsengisoli]|uniref:Linalool dehydratase/isomerase domain-containing protein n=1 Tax=Nocardioides marmoriginsengisoli TaxID=661483 RepID=A0A3N0CC99_9ACTN|nr:hypothetical protein EFK50_16995 [Nocardioides marmoriginsengisoli]
MYAAVLALGALPWLLDLDRSWKVLGAGLAFPGAGFVTALSWSTLWLVLVLVLAGLAGVAWFGSGMVIALPVVWLGSAAAAVAVVDEPERSGYLVALLAVAVVAVSARVGLTRRAGSQDARRDERNRTLASTIGTVRTTRARAVTALAGTAPELTDAQVAALRYAVDLAHQPHDDWSGFDTIDIFQPAAVRYQINQLGWALAVAQSAYAPAFGGYLSSGQRGLIERYLQPEVLGYWKYERAWGHLRWDADPVGRDNIMLTGYYGLNLALYAGNTGDTRYHADGALPFRVTRRRTYPHSADDVRDSLLSNYARYHDGLCLYPCEPNWSYSACNFRGAATLASFDRLEGTGHWPRLRDHFLEKLTSEFTQADGSVVALRSTLTGLPVPFPMPDSVLPKELSPIAPEIAERYWALVREEILTQVDGRWVADLPGVGVDFGNYTKSDMFALGGIYGSAREMGDTEVADAMLALIDELEPHADGPALWYPNRSTLFNATMAMDRLLRPGGWHDAINVPTAAEVLSGPVLDQVPYPEVLVLAASTDGAGISVTVTPGAKSGAESGAGPGRRALAFARLSPGARYAVSTGGDVVAAGDGRATVEIDLTGRLDVALTPVR